MVNDYRPTGGRQSPFHNLLPLLFTIYFILIIAFVFILIHFRSRFLFILTLLDGGAYCMVQGGTASAY